MSKNRVCEIRRELGLAPHKRPRSKWENVERAGCGTNASYARGCRCEACTEAKKEYYREYRKQRRVEGVGDNHGTAYGYQLGCRSRSGCTGKITCTDAMLEADRVRRRMAGIPAKELVDATPVREHVLNLRAAGMTAPEIADAASVPYAAVKTVLYSRGAERPPVETLLAERASAILAVPMPMEKAA